MTQVDMVDSTEDTATDELMLVPTDGVAEAEPEPMEGVATGRELMVVPEKPQDDSAWQNQWEVHHFSTIAAPKHYSETFTIGGYPWRLLIFPRGNKCDFLSVYLDAGEPEHQPPNWKRPAQFKLTLVNQLDPSKPIVKDATHTFQASANDWGFTQFVPLAELHDPQRGYLVNDRLIFRVEVSTVVPDSHLYDSKKETGYVGLKNQGATCYMNSLLQTLYNINYFRQAVYHMPTTEEEKPEKSIPLALQSLFYKLQFGNTSVSTKDLTKSFGWDTFEAFMQHDVQELNRVLCEKLEDKMKGTKVEGAINKLFEGHTINYVECINVDCKSERRESYMDLQLDVKGCRDVLASFHKYTEQEVLEGENQYKSDTHGLQDARKGVLFENFPPVLQLQLKRFEYDFQRDVMVKINDRYEFPGVLDLDVEDRKFLTPGSDAAVRNLYRLHSVLVHSGGVHGGHYYAYIRPDGRQWLKFDDDKVTKEEARRAMDEQFGGEDENAPPAPGYNAPPTFKFTKYSNAYMLVYIRESDWNQVMLEVTKKDIQDHVRLRLEVEAAEKERKRIEKAEAHLFTYVRLATDDDMRTQIGSQRFFDLVDHDKVRSFRIKKAAGVSELRAEVERELGVPPDRQRYWLWARRQNGTFRPNRPLSPEEEAGRLADIRDVTQTKALTTDLKLFLETPISPAGPLPQRRQEILLFLKLYDPAQASLQYVGRLYAAKAAKVADLFPILRKQANFADDVELEAWEEIKFEPNVMTERLEKKSTLQAAQLEDGDIICFQRVVSREEEATLRHPHVHEFLAYVKNRLLVTFKKLDSPKEEGLQLELSRENTYDEVTAALARAAGAPDGDHIRLTQHNYYGHAPKPSPLKYQGPTARTLADMLAGHTHGQLSDILYYEVLDMRLPELELLKLLKVKFHGERGEEVSEHTLRLPRDATVEDCLNELAKQIGPPALGRPMRLLEIFYCRIYKVFDPADRIDTINDTYWQMRAEVLPEDQATMDPQRERLIHCVHYHSEGTSQVTNFGDPFFLRVSEEETLAEVKPRIQAKLGVSNEDFAKWRFAHNNPLRPPELLAEEDVVAARFPRPAAGLYGPGGEAPYLGMEHPDSHPRRSHHHTNRHSHYERPVKIYN